ncbi:Ran GAP Rna1 [Stygiomarasmius scandens]|uniref:Ran GAP Rna1 n=1 Tax=Marasmiellus scandens TaxID=2682957 RepID=A0ABR1JXG7_9AGAR
MSTAANGTVFSLKGRGLKLNTREDIAPLLAEVDPTKLEEIHFGGNTIGVDASLALAEFLQKAVNIKIADFADIFTGRLITEIPQALTAICDALIDKTSLIELDLSDNAFGGRSVDPIVPFLTQNRHFQVLKLNNNGLGPAGGEVLANALLKSAELSKAEGKKSNLRTFICGRNRLENGSASTWADAFAAHEGLVEIRMPQNGIRMEGITALAHGLAKNPNLEYIDMQDNTFTKEGELSGVKAWANSLRAWPELRTLNLSDCVLSGDGEVPSLLTALAEGSNPKLHTLLLQNNNLEAETFSLLSENIHESLKNLTKLELQWNDAEEEDENLASLGVSMKQRGGKLYVNDEDEEEEEDAVEKEAEAEAAIEAAVEDKVLEGKPAKDEADELAQLMGGVKIQ